MILISIRTFFQKIAIEGSIEPAKGQARGGTAVYITGRLTTELSVTIQQEETVTALDLILK